MNLATGQTTPSEDGRQRQGVSFAIHSGQGTRTITNNVASQPQTDLLSEQEQKILSEIQDLQRQLFELKTAEAGDEDDKLGDSAGGLESIMGKNRLIMVSNRLPVSTVVNEDGTRDFVMSSGGLVTALSGVQNDLDFIWIGWLGCEIPEEEQPLVRERLLAEHNCLPVFLSDKLKEQYYDGFSNGVLWPLFHYVPLPMYKAGGERKFDVELWGAYKTANILFAEAVLQVYNQSTDMVWVHDYHLMRLPAELRIRSKHIRVAWYLHTPFPTSEIYRILPVRRELLEGLLQADLVGFQTYDYARHFLSACSRVLEVESSPRGVEYNNHYCAIGVFPVGVDAENISEICRSEGVAQRVRELKETFAGRKILLGVDRVDYIKGMPHKLLGLELFLARHPEWRGKVTLIQIGVPTREGVPEYQKLGQQVNELVGRINGTHGTLEYSPIHYINQSVPQDELFAIYKIADVCLVTSVRDGMNLVSHEYVIAQNEWDNERGCEANFPDSSFNTLNSPVGAPPQPPPPPAGGGRGDSGFAGLAAAAAAARGAVRSSGTSAAPGGGGGCGGGGGGGREAAAGGAAAGGGAEEEEGAGVDRLVREGPGVLVLSEFAGSAQSLSGAIRVNPWNTEELASAIHTALLMSPTERRLRQNKLHRYVASHTASYWAAMCLAEFQETIAAKPTIRTLPLLNAKAVVTKYERAMNRLIVSDYDGTLTKIQTLPQLAQPAPALVEILRTLSSDPRNTVFIMSGRERRFLESWLGKLKVGIGAENGFYHRMPTAKEWESIGEEIELAWKELVLPIMKYFTDRTPGTYIESRESSLAWHYKDADPHFGTWQAKDMQISMEDVLSNLPLEIIQGKHIVEVRHRAVSKARVLEKVLEELCSPESVALHGGHEVDFIFCVGDDRSDEDMFQFLKRWKKTYSEELKAAAEAANAAIAVQDEVEAGTAAHASAASEVSAGASAGASADVGSGGAGSGAGDHGDRGVEEGGGGEGGGGGGFAKWLQSESGQSGGAIAMRRVPSMFNVRIGNEMTSEATSYVENMAELRRVLRAFASVSKKDSDLRNLVAADN